MSTSNPKRTSTKAGIALSADAREKLQNLANWMEMELAGNHQSNQVRLDGVGSIITDTSRWITYVSPFGALVQMYEPFGLVDAHMLLPTLYSADRRMVVIRVTRILDISVEEYLTLLRYLYRDSYAMSYVVKMLRTLL